MAVRNLRSPLPPTPSPTCQKDTGTDTKRFGCHHLLQQGSLKGHVFCVAPDSNTKQIWLRKPCHMPHHPQGLRNRRVSVCVRAWTAVASESNPQSLCSGSEFMRQLIRLLPIVTFYELTCPFSSKSGKLGDSPDPWLYLQARREGCLRSQSGGLGRAGSKEPIGLNLAQHLLSSFWPLTPQNGSAWLLVSAKLSHSVLRDSGDGGRGRI